VESRWICEKCGGWIIENSHDGGGSCDTCGRVILSDGSIDDIDCEE